MFSTLGSRPRRGRGRRGGRGRRRRDGSGRVVVIGNEADGSASSDEGSYSDDGSYSDSSNGNVNANSPYSEDSSSEGEYSYETDSEGSGDAPAKPQVAAPAVVAAPIVPSAEQVKLDALHDDLMADPRFGTELLGDKVECKLCGKDRVTIDAFDTHACEPRAAHVKRSKPKASLTSASLTASQFGAGIGCEASESSSCDSSSSSESCEEIVTKVKKCKKAKKAKAKKLADCIDKEPCDAPVVVTEAFVKPQKKKKSKKGSCDAKAVEMADSYACWMSKADKKLDSAGLIEATVSGAPFKTAFKGADGSLVVLDCALGTSRSKPAKQAYYVSMGVAQAGASADSKIGMHRIVKFSASDATSELSHKLVTKSVINLHEAVGNKALVASNLDTVLATVKKITE